jgi:hypothetical protein
VQQSSFPPVLDDVDDVFGVLQHYPPKVGLSFWKGGTPGIFGVPQHHPSKSGLSFPEEVTPGIFLRINFILQNLGFLLKRERLLVFLVCRSIIL